MEENDYTTLRAYAEGGLSGDALEAFERQLRQDPELQSELDLYLTLKSMENLRLKKQLQQIDFGDQTATPPAPLFVRRRVWWVAAASIALIVAAVWWMRDSSSKQSASQIAATFVAKPYASPVSTMGGNDTRPDAVEQAFLAYRKGDYADASAQLSALADNVDAEDEVLFYAGESFLQIGQNERAIQLFERVKPGDWREKADWRRALALLKNNRPDDARPILEELKKGSYKKQAETLLEAMK